MATEPLERIESLQQLLDSTLETFESTQALLEANDQLIKSSVTADLQQLKKKFILDSFKLNKTQKEFKDWENTYKIDVVENQASKYNETLGEISQINLRIGKQSSIYEALSDSIALPEFLVSRKTLETFNDESLLEIARGDGDELPKSVQLTELFSLDSSSALPLPDFKRISQLINIEYRLRLEKRLKLELLTLIKSNLDSENRSWNKNLSYLNDFINKSVPDAIAEVEKIKAEEADSKLKEEQVESDSSDEEEEVEIEEVEREEEGEPEEVHEVPQEEEEEDEEEEDIVEDVPEVDHPHVSDEEEDDDMLLDH